MRRIAVLSSVAIAATAITAALTGTSSAASGTTWSHGGPVAPSSSFTTLAKPIGKVHTFSATTKGAKTAGSWYYYLGTNGKKYVWLSAKTTDTKADGLRAAFCFKTPLTTSKAYCYWDTKGYKTSFTVKGWLYTTDHFVYSVETGKPKSDTFYWWYKSAWKQVR